MATSRSSTPETPDLRRAPILAVQESLVTVDVGEIPIRKNEVGHIVTGEERLSAEVLRIQGGQADLQVFEDTRGVKVGDIVEMSGELLSVTLGPGMLGSVYDGLQKPLDEVAQRHGFFLPRGVDLPPLNEEKRWPFEARAKPGDQLVAGQVIGETPEGAVVHRVMVPFDEPEPVELLWVGDGPLRVSDPVARVRRPSGEEVTWDMRRRWPVRQPLAERMLERGQAERRYPSEPLSTTQRIIDTFLPIARGGTACIPGPFGAGKTVLQSLIARYAAVDIVIIIACGERAGEVVETIAEYPETQDPRTGRSLMERTIIICNTSSMPVAARESSIYTGITLGEYYRQMGYDVLCIADSTSRWAQAMRETSGRMEEIPGEEAFPAYLDSSIKRVYERAGVLGTPGGGEGSLTLVGTVSPAGGNFEEPVTQATLATVKTFLGLSSERAYKRYYPAIDPLISWSRYLEQLREWYSRELGDSWVDEVKAMQGLLRRGASIYQTMQVTGEEGVSLRDFVTWQKSQFLDIVFLQQDAFDAVDASMAQARQVESFRLVRGLVEADYRFEDKEQARAVFTELTGLYKNLNYSAADSPEYTRFAGEIDALAQRYLETGA